mgnify:FL=1
MKVDNIVKKLEREGYEIIYKKWGYWDGIPFVKLDGFDFAIVEGITINNSYTINMEFVYNHVLDAISIAEEYNYLILDLIKNKPVEAYNYEPYLILSMQDYYHYKKELFPWDNWSHTWKQLNSEWLYS